MLALYHVKEYRVYLPFILIHLSIITMIYYYFGMKKGTLLVIAYHLVPLLLANHIGLIGFAPYFFSGLALGYSPTQLFCNKYGECL